MIKKTNNIFLVFILLIISIALIVAFIIQYGLGYQPCKLCLYERIPYILSILLIIKILFSTKYKKIILLTLALIFIMSTFLSFYHFGIERGFFNESALCLSENFSETLSKEQLLDQLKKSNISCKTVDFKILGFSLASINAIFSFILSVIFVQMFKNYEKN